MNETKIIESIIRLSKSTTWHPYFGNYVPNKWIYHEVTDMKNYSYKKWIPLRDLLMGLSGKEHEYEGVKYLITAYQPMFKDDYNFLINGDVNRLVGGFQVNVSK